MNRKLLLAIVLLSGIGESVYGTTIPGVVWYQRAYNVNTTYAPTGTFVKFCYDNGTAQAASGQGECYTANVNNSTYTGYNFEITVPAGRSYYVFAWNNADDWGSDSSIANLYMNGAFGIRVNVQSTSNILNVYSAPRPHRPTAVYPVDGARKVPYTFTLKWTSGLDADRSWPGTWPVTYDVYANGSGAAESLILSNISCNPDSSGYCSYPIFNQPPTTLLFWRVVAKLNPQLGGPGNPYYSTSSSRFSFATQGTTYSLSTANGNVVTADGCGGRGASATATGVGPCETLKIVDLNGGTLDSGDTVYMQVYATPYYFVTGSGGSLAANSTGGGSISFTISKTRGSGTIQNGDTVSLRNNGLYCSAELGGGDAVNCNRAALGPWEIFTFGIMP